MSTIVGAEPYAPLADPAYDLERARWRAQLSDVDCRSIAYEYRVAISAHEHRGGPYPDDCLVDAWLEYKERFGNGSPHQEFVKKAKTVRPTKQNRERLQRGSLSPLYNQAGELL